MPTVRPDDELLNVQQVADTLGLSKRTVYKIIEDGQLDVIRVGRGARQLRVTRRAVLAYLNGRRSDIYQPRRAGKAVG